MDLNNSHIVLVNSDKELLYKRYEEDYFIIVSQEFSLYTVSISISNLIFIGGISKKSIIYDINKKTSFEINIKNEVLSKIYTDSDSINYISDNLTIMASNFSNINHNVIAFGGSNSIFCVKDIEKNKYLYIHDRKDNFTYTYSISFSKDGNYIATAHEDGIAILWDSISFEIIYIFKVNKNISKNEFFENKNEKHSNHINHIEFFPNSDGLVIGTSESKIIFFDIKYMKKIAEIDLSIEPLDVYAFSFNERGDKLTVSLGNKLYQFKI
jgi:WD40 repeat protein